MFLPFKSFEIFNCLSPYVWNIKNCFFLCCIPFCFYYDFIIEISVRPYINLHRHEYWDPQAVEKPVQTGTGVFIKELCSRHFASEGEIVTHMRGQQLTENYLMQNGFNNPIVIDGKDGLDITIPPEHFSIYDVEQCIGSDKNIDVIDVMRQTDFKMSLRAFVEYFNNPNRNRVLNCISLEFSSTGYVHLRFLLLLLYYLKLFLGCLGTLKLL